MKTLVKCKLYLMTLPAAILFMVGTAVSDNHTDVSTTDVNTDKSANRIEKTFNVNPGGRLTVNSDIGDVDVQTTTQNTVKIVVTKKAKSRLDSSVQAALADFEVTFYATPSGVSIRGTFQRGRNYWRYWKRQLNQLDIRFLVTVPR